MATYRVTIRVGLDGSDHSREDVMDEVVRWYADERSAAANNAIVVNEDDPGEELPEVEGWH